MNDDGCRWSHGDIQITRAEDTTTAVDLSSGVQRQIYSNLGCLCERSSLIGVGEYYVNDGDTQDGQGGQQGWSGWGPHAAVVW